MTNWHFYTQLTGYLAKPTGLTCRPGGKQTFPRQCGSVRGSVRASLSQAQPLGRESGSEREPALAHVPSSAVYGVTTDWRALRHPWGGSHLFSSCHLGPLAPRSVLTPPLTSVVLPAPVSPFLPQLYLLLMAVSSPHASSQDRTPRDSIPLVFTVEVLLLESILG